MCCNLLGCTDVFLWKGRSWILFAFVQLGAGLAQVVSEQPLRGGFDILVPRGDSNQQAGNAAMDNIPLKPYNPTATAPPDPQV